MDNLSTSDIKTPFAFAVKQCWKVGNNTVVVIDKELVKRLGIEEQNTKFQEELIEGGIFLRLLRSDQFNSTTEEK